MKSIELCIAIAAFSAVGSELRADLLNYTSANRVVQANAGINPSLPGSSQSTTSFGLWNATEFFSLFGEDPGNSSYLGGAGQGRQNTTLGPSRLFGTIDSTAWDGNQGWSGIAGASLSATFTITSPTIYQLTGSWQADSPSSHPGGANVAGATLTLTGPGTYRSAGTIGANPYRGDFDFSGIFAPGDYTLEVSTGAQFGYPGLNLGSRAGALSFDLTVPGPGTSALLAMGLLPALRRRR